MKLKPLHDWAVIKRSEAEERSPGGIIIPDTARDRPSEGIIVSIGPGSYKKIKEKERFVPTTLHPGQRVAYPKYAAKEAEVGGKKFTLVREDDILGTFEGERIPARKMPEQQDRPVVTKGKKETIPALPAMEGSSGKGKATGKRAVRKSSKSAGGEKTKKKAMRKPVAARTKPKTVKKTGAKKKEKTPAKKKVIKKTAGTRKTAGRTSPSKSKTAQRKKTGPSPAKKKKKS